MAGYQNVSKLFWKDPKARNWSDADRSLALYLLTGPHANAEGLYWLPTDYVCADLGWTPKKAAETFARLERDGFCRRDPETETVLVVKALKYRTPSGEPQLRGAVGKVSEVPSTPLFHEFRASAERYAPELVAYLDKEANGELSEHYSTPPPDPPDTPSGGSRDTLETPSGGSGDTPDTPSSPLTPPQALTQAPDQALVGDADAPRDSPPDPEPPPDPDPPKPKPRDELFEAIVNACGWDWTQLTSSARGNANKATKELRQIGATPDAVYHRAGEHSQRWPGCDVTPTSLAKNWSQLATPRPVNGARDGPAMQERYYQAGQAAGQQGREAS